MSKKAMLYDASRCTACRGCQVACKQWNDLRGWDYSKTHNTGSYENPPDLSPETWMRISFQEYEDKQGQLQWLFLKRGCFHCHQAACVEVCPTHALKHDPTTDSVTVETALCNGCGYCSQFCPFHIPRLEANVLTGAGKSSKCTLCQDRISNGVLPACVQTCTADALSFGEWDQMVALGNARVEAVKPRFPQANLYGASILGGLGNLYVLLQEPEVYSLPANPTYTVANIWQEVVQPVAEVSFGVGVLLAGIAFIIARRHIRMEDVE
jgi:formate dehydrogenase iron-sulfur subunit